VHSRFAAPVREGSASVTTKRTLLRLASAVRATQAPSMFMVDEETAAAIRRAWEEGGELAGVVELRRHFPLIADNEQARRCVRAIVGWGQPPRPSPEEG
jgi:hypothetical protein